MIDAIQIVTTTASREEAAKIAQSARSNIAWRLACK